MSVIPKTVLPSLFNNKVAKKKKRLLSQIKLAKAKLNLRKIFYG
jgi:hypothetical protein